MEEEIHNKVEYVVAIISEFAKVKHLTQSQAFRYLRRFKGISLINLHSNNIRHTLRREDVLDDLTAYCRRQGGAIA